MKMKVILYALLPLAFCLFSTGVFSQCEPLGPEECPDPENNGAVCPEFLPAGFVNQLYSSVATILPPPSIDTLSFQIDINHIRLDSILNLPEGLEWESNAEDNRFFPGTYYCVLIEGTPSVADTFRLKIYISIFVELFGDTIFVTQFVDTTSLSMVIAENSGLGDAPDGHLFILSSNPNPFESRTSIHFYCEKAGRVEWELFDLTGRLMDSRIITAGSGENYFHYDGECLSAGTYFYLLKSGGRTAAGKIVRGNGR